MVTTAHCSQLKLAKDTYGTVKELSTLQGIAEAELQKRSVQKNRRDLHKSQILKLFGRDLELSREDLDLTIKEVRGENT